VQPEPVLKTNHPSKQLVSLLPTLGVRLQPIETHSFEAYRRAEA